MDIPHRSTKPLSECGDCAAPSVDGGCDFGFGMGNAVIGGPDRWDTPFGTAPRTRTRKKVRKRRK